MRHEAVTLTQNTGRPYAREGIIFMAQEDEKKQVTKDGEEGVDETSEEEKGQKEKKAAKSEPQVTKEERIQQQVETWKQNFEQTLEEAAEKHNISKELLKDASPSVISFVLRGIETTKLESILGELRDMERTAQGTAVVGEIRQAESQYEKVLEEVARRTIEETDALRQETVGAQVFSQFQKYLGLEGVTVQVDPSTQEVSMHTTSDGQQFILVPQPTLENMIAVARQLRLGEFSEKTTENLSEFAKELKIAASLLDSRMFSPEAVMVLYNAGYQLEQLVHNANLTDGEQQPLKKITSYKELFPILHTTELQWQNTSPQTQDKIFFTMLLGGEHRQKEFMRWRRQHPDQMSLTLDEQQEAFATYLQGKYADRDKRDRMLQRARPFIERSLRSDGKASRLIAGAAGEQLQPELMQKLLDPWRMLVGEHGYKEIAEKFRERMELDNTEMADMADSDGLLFALEEVNNEFRPGSVDGEALDYLPAHIAERMRDELRDPVACIIAVAYEKEVLQRTLGEGYLVLPEIAGNHATLLVVNLEDDATIVRLDPSAPLTAGSAAEILREDDPVAEAIRDSLADQYPEDILDNFFADDLQASEVNAKGLTVQEEDSDGVMHTIISGDRLITSALLTNMAATSEYWDEQNLSDDQQEQVRLAAAAQATQVAPENPQAWAVKAVLESGGSVEDLVTDTLHEQSIAAQKARELGVELDDDQTIEDLRIGQWRPTGGAPNQWGAGGPPIPPDVAPIIDTVEDAINSLAAFQGKAPDQLSMRDLPDDFLENQITALRTLVKDYTDKVLAGDPTAPTPDTFKFADERLNELTRAYKAHRGGRGDRLQSFNLLSSEQDIFMGTDTKEMYDFIDEQVMSFGTRIIPGFPLPQHETNIMQGKLDDILKTIRSNPNRLTDPEIEKVRLYTERRTQLLYAVLAASELESGNERALEGAQQRMSQMDNEGGHDVMATLMEMNDGRPHMLSDELSRRMEQVRQEKKRLVSSAADIRDSSITAGEYRNIRKDIIEEQIQLAEQGLGRYAYLQGDPEKLRTTVTADVNFANVLFIIDGRASAIGIRGENPKIYDPSSDAFVDQQYKNHVRYDALTPSKEKVFDLIREERARWWIRLRFGEKMLEQVEKTHNLETFVRFNGIELLTPATQKYWEGQFIRVRPMLYVIGQWRNEHSWKDAHNVDAGEYQYGLGLRLLAASKVVRPGADDKHPRDIDYDPVIKRIEETYVDEAYKNGLDSGDAKTAYTKKTIQYGLMNDYLVQFFPDELIKPFAYEHDVWTDHNGGSLDPRFVTFFTGAHTAFLDNFGVPGGLSGTELAQARFKVFQDRFAPLIAAIRSENINGLRDPNNPNNKAAEKGTFDPRQTNFGTVSYNEFNLLKDATGNSRGTTAEHFRNMMAALSVALVQRGHHSFGPEIRNTDGNANNMIGRLAYDPMMEHILRQSPITIADVPYWMLHGEDIYGKTHPFDVRTAFGGENQVSRWVSDAKALGAAREGILKVPLGNPNQFDETFIKPLNEVVPIIAGFYGNSLGMELRASVGQALMKAMFVEGAELVGMERMPWRENSEFRKIYGRRTQGWSEADLKTRYWTEYAPLIKDEYRQIMFEGLFGKKWKRRSRTLWKFFFTLFMMTVAESIQVGMGTFQGELKG